MHNFNFETLINLFAPIIKAEIIPQVEEINNLTTALNVFPISEPDKRHNGDKNITCEGYSDVVVWAKTEVSDPARWAGWEAMTKNMIEANVKILENFYFGNTSVLVFAVNIKEGNAKQFIANNNAMYKIFPPNGSVAPIYHAKVAQRLFGLPKRFWDYPASIPDSEIYADLKKAFRTEKKKKNE